MGFQCSKCQINNENELIHANNVVTEHKHCIYMENLEDSFESDPNYPPSTTLNKTLEEKTIQFSKPQKESQHTTMPSECFKSEELQIDEDSKFFGQIKDGQANGNGKLWLKNGDYYEGDFLNNYMHGKGIYNYKNGPIFEGQFLYNKPDGFGIESWPDGSVYEGCFKEGKKSGKGCYKWLEISLSFNNLYRNDNIKAVFILVNGKIIKFMAMEDTIGLMEGYVDRQQFQSYSGSWVNNQMHGRGKYIWQDGKCYDGEYQNDRKQGFGIFYWPDCKQYQGQWKDGKQHGKGIMMYPDGKKRAGQWENGKLIKYTEDDNIQIIPENWLQQ